MSGWRIVSFIVTDDESPKSAQGCRYPFIASAAISSCWTSSGASRINDQRWLIAAFYRPPRGVARRPHHPSRLRRYDSVRISGLFVLAAGLLGAQADPAAPPRDRLAALPSTPGPHAEKLRTLGDDSWLDLGSPAADGAWGKARGRSWTPKMAYAPDLRGAFLCATGVHGFVKPDGHYMDDLWFYDANAHRWICLYPGAHAKNLRLKLDKNGFEVDPDGNPVPVSYLSHGYNNLTYNPDLRRYMIIHTQCPWWDRAIPQRYEWLGLPKEKQTYGNAGPVITSVKHPWFFDVAQGRWARPFIEGDGPDKGRF